MTDAGAAALATHSPNGLSVVPPEPNHEMSLDWCGVKARVRVVPTGTDEPSVICAPLDAFVIVAEYVMV
jgi:hypothetical protein